MFDTSKRKVKYCLVSTIISLTLCNDRGKYQILTQMFVDTAHVWIIYCLLQKLCAVLYYAPRPWFDEHICSVWGLCYCTLGEWVISEEYVHPWHGACFHTTVKIKVMKIKLNFLAFKITPLSYYFFQACLPATNSHIWSVGHFFLVPTLYRYRLKFQRQKISLLEHQLS